MTIRPDERALLDAYASENSMTITELVRACLRDKLGTADAQGDITRPGTAILLTPSKTAVRRLVRLQEQRGLALLEAKRDRQRS